MDSNKIASFVDQKKCVVRKPFCVFEHPFSSASVALMGDRYSDFGHESFRNLSGHKNVAILLVFVIVSNFAYAKSPNAANRRL